MPHFAKLVTVAIGVFLIVSVRAESYSQGKWAPDGWGTDFGLAHCYLGHTYDDLRNEEIGLINVNFIQVTDLVLAKQEYSFELWEAMKNIGVKQNELVFTVALPGRVSWRKEVRSQFAVALVVDGLEAQPLDTKDFFEDWELQVWFVIREPDSRRLIRTFSDKQPVEFRLKLNDDSDWAFKYDSSPGLEFKVRRAQFETCLAVVAQESVTE